MNEEPFIEADPQSRSALFSAPSGKAIAPSNPSAPKETGKIPVDTKASSQSAARLKKQEILKMQEDELASIDVNNLDFGNLDITSDDMNLEEIEEDISRIKDYPEVYNAVLEGKDLKDYTVSVGSNLVVCEKGTIEDYVKEGEYIANLFAGIISSDAVLEQLENLLNKFQSDIKNIGAEIKTLQDESVTRQLKLKNRMGVETRVSQFIEGITVPEYLHNHISSDEVNEAYFEYLVAFNRKISYVETNRVIDSKEVLAIKDVDQELIYLRNRAVSKLRQFMLNRINACKSYQMLKKLHKEFLKSTSLYQFLFKHAHGVAEEVRIAYKEMTSKLYASHFRSFLTTVSKLQYEMANKNDVIASQYSDESSKLSVSSFFTGKKSMKNKASPFSIAQRQPLIDDLLSINSIYKPPTDSAMSANPSLSLSSSNSNQSSKDNPNPPNPSSTNPNNQLEKQPYEFIFRGMVCVLMDVLKGEMKFIQDFFLDLDPELVEYMFGKVVEMYNSQIDHYVNSSYDGISTLIMIVMIQKWRVTMTTSSRIGNSLDGFFETTYAKLVSKFNMIFESNLVSVKNAQAKDLSSVDFQPHYITRRYAEFLLALLTLTQISEQSGDVTFVKRVHQQLSKLREEVEKLLIRLADAKFKDWKSKGTFLLNNYDLVVSVLHEKNITNSGDGLQFEKLVDMKMKDFEKDELNRSFGRLLSFVNDYSSLLDDQVETPKVSLPREEEVESLLKEFNANWKVELEKINGNIIKVFSNLKRGMQAFERIMESMIDAYTKLVKIIKKHYKNLRMSKFFTPETEITYEMKRSFVRID